MCGIFGAIGTNIDIGKIRALAVANRERGSESLGFFDSSGKIAKRGLDPYKALADERIASYLAHPKRWFLAGHTRQSTRGAVSDKNAHPFRYGNIVGAHNGIVCAPKEYAVDSEYLFDRLKQRGPNPQDALTDISGYWALSYFDGDAFYLTTHNNSVSIGRDDTGTWYYSSDKRHLAACTGVTGIMELYDGGGVKFVAGCDKPTDLPAFVGTGGWMAHDARTSGGRYSSYSSYDGYDDYENFTYVKGGIRYKAHYDANGRYVGSTEMGPDDRSGKRGNRKKTKKAKRSEELGIVAFEDANSREELIEYARCAKAFGYRGLTDFCDQNSCRNYFEAMDIIDGMIREAEMNKRDEDEYRQAYLEYASDDIPF